jgi:hypothetical protein
MRTARTRVLAGLGLQALLLLATGCGRPELPINPKVEGIVTLDSVPLAGVRVEFIPEGTDPKAGGPTSSGFTDDKGRYELTYGEQKTGAVLGKHRVVILAGRRAAEGRDEREAASDRGKALPQDYSIAARTPVRVEVTADKHTYDLKLTRNLTPQP